jgi:hypothetical protein
VRVHFDFEVGGLNQAESIMSPLKEKPVAGILVLLFMLAGLRESPTIVAEDVRPPIPEVDPAVRAAVEEDWTAQERRRKRQPHSPEAIRDALDRAARLLEDLGGRQDSPDLGVERAFLERHSGELNNLASLDEATRLNLYLQVRWMTRTAALKNPLFSGRPLVFMKRHRFVSQMLHEYLGYFCDYGDIAGGGVYLLRQPGYSLRIRDLVDGRLPRGNYTTLAVAPDARTLYFAFAERASQKPDYYSPQRRSFHIFAMDADGAQLRQLTDGIEDDFDPCPLPDGEITFMSTRRGGFGRCHNPWEPLPAYTLHRMDRSGGNVRTLSFHETNQWHPAMLADGRIVYSRWDYVDRSAANFHGLWASRPDGTSPSLLFGNYTHRINACYQPHSIPGSQRIAFIAGAHHADVGGSLVLVDPARASLDRETGEDQFDAIETLTPDVCFPEAPGWPDSYYHSPWPLSENYYLVSFSFDPLPGMGPGVKRDTETGLYYFDRFGNLELLYREAGISCMYPIPLAIRPNPPIVCSTREPQLGDEAELFLLDVRQSLMPLPADRPIRQLRVFQVLPKTETHVANEPRIGYANAESARMLLGSVNVEADGSAYFRVPARKPLYFQAVDEHDHAVQTMRSVVYLQPGERRGCVGCHEPVSSTPSGRMAVALRRPPSEIEPEPDGTRPLSYTRLVQPVLDRHCVECHDGALGPGKSQPALTGEPSGRFTKSYEALRAHVRWYEWGKESIAQIATRPGHIGADASPLTRVLSDANHSSSVKLPVADRHRINLWLDSNVPFYGTYGKEEQRAQQQGLAVSPPQVQ